MMKIEEIVPSAEQTAPVEITEINCDMDGVIADFARGVVRIFPSFVEGATEADKKQDRRMWASIGAYQKQGHGFWFDLEPTPDAMQLWAFIKPFNPYILTAAGQPQFGASEQKMRWLQKYFQVPTDRIRITQRAADKAQFARPGVILIDDKRKALDPWEQAGGIGVWHKSAADSIQQMKKLGL